MKQFEFAYLNITDKLKKIIGNRSILFFYIRTYIINSLIRTNPDYFIISYPKCGRTWLRIMIQKYINAIDYEGKKFFNASLIQSKSGNIIKFEHDQGNWIPAPPKISKLKFNKKKYMKKKVLFLVRDPRDIIVSSWYHLKFRERIFKDDISAFIRNELIGINKIISFFNLWYSSIEKLDRWICISYEDLVSDTSKEFTKIIQFLDLPLNIKQIKKVVKQCSLQKMKEMEINGELNEPWMKPGNKNDLNSMKVRKGKVGSYRDEMDTEDMLYLDKIINSNLNPYFRYKKNRKSLKK